MVFLYGALGFLMISGIAAMIEVASSVSKFTKISESSFLLKYYSMISVNIA